MRRRFMSQENKEIFDYNNYLTIEALEDNCYVSFTNDIEYGIDGIGWRLLPAKTASPPIKIGQTISFRGELNPEPNTGIGTFTIHKSCNLKGNCLSLLFGDNAINRNSLSGKSYAFYYLFRYCTTIKNVSPNFLPATTLDESCYFHMFYGCISLVNAPELPATTLVSSCYDSMFNGCINLNYIKMLATDISAKYCLYNWVYNVSPTGTFVKSKDATWDVVGDSGVPTGWTVITDDQENEGGEITFYLDDSVDAPYEMKAASGMTWEQWVNSNFAPTEGVLRDFRIYTLNPYDMIQLYHELAGYDMIVYNDINREGYADGTEQIENGKTYYIY